MKQLQQWKGHSFYLPQQISPVSTINPTSHLALLLPFSPLPWSPASTLLLDLKTCHEWSPQTAALRCCCDHPTKQSKTHRTHLYKVEELLDEAIPHFLSDFSFSRKGHHVPNFLHTNPRRTSKTITLLSPHSTQVYLLGPHAQDASCANRSSAIIMGVMASGHPNAYSTLPQHSTPQDWQCLSKHSLKKSQTSMAIHSGQLHPMWLVTTI